MTFSICSASSDHFEDAPHSPVQLIPLTSSAIVAERSNTTSMSGGIGATPVVVKPQAVPPVPPPPVPRIPLIPPVAVTTPEPPVPDGIGMLPPSDSPLHPVPAAVTAISATVPRNQVIGMMMTSSPAPVHGLSTALLVRPRTSSGLVLAPATDRGARELGCSSTHQPTSGAEPPVSSSAHVVGNRRFNPLSRMGGRSRTGQARPRRRWEHRRRGQSAHRARDPRNGGTPD